MKITDLNTGIKFELELFDSDGTKMEPLLVSEFEWAENDKVAFIAAPIFEGIYYPVHIGMSMNIYYNNKVEFYKFSANLLDRTVKDNLPLMKIEITSDIIRIQRRQFFRFDCMLSLKYRILDFTINLKNDKTPYIETVTRDLSGGGVCIAVKEKIEMNKILDCELFLSQTEIVKFVGKVLRLSSIDGNGIYKYEAGVEFLKIDNKCRESIISFIFQEQRKLRKKGLV